MKTKLFTILWISLAFLLAAQTGLCLNGKSVVRLKRAGVSDQTIQLIIKEKIIETAAYTLQDIIDMKKAGLGEKTLQMLIKENSYLRDTEPIIYGKDIQTLRFTTVQDVIELKKAGLSDEVIQAMIAVSGERYYAEREEALDLLRDMNILLDLR
ncbi:MAG: hypothetical protein PVG70_15345, partial [Desulfobacterales bacterium]